MVMVRTCFAGLPSAVERQDASMFGHTPAQFAGEERSPFDRRAAAAAIAGSGIASERVAKAAPMRSAATPDSGAAALALAENGAISRPAMIRAMPIRIAAATNLRDWIICQP